MPQFKIHLFLKFKIKLYSLQHKRIQHMSADKLIASWKKNSFKPVYLLHGEEDYFIDELMDYAEHQILTESEASFNLTVFYGKDADWAAVVTACRRYPMFAEKQVVLLKEAQMLNGIDKLEAYLENPLSSTIFIIGYKGKKLDGRMKISGLINKKGEIFESKKIAEYNLHDWINEQVKLKGFKISAKSVSLLQESIGNDLSRIVNEIDKLAINISGKNSIDEDDIEKYIGISKEYNVFELQAAIANKDLSTAIKIVNYFEHNPKAVPIQMALGALYAFFSKIYSAYGLSNTSEATLKPLFYFNPNAVKQAQTMMKNYGYAGTEKIILLLHHYNMKSVGVGDSGTESASLLKEMVVKIIVA